MELSKNVVLEWEDQRRERAVHLSLDQREWITIPLDARRFKLKRYDVNELLDALERRVVTLLDYDPMLAPYATTPDDQIPETFRLVRDRRWKQVGAVFTDPRIFDDACRCERIKSVGPPGALYRLLTRYLQYGQTQNALLPEYDRCGARGQARVITVNSRRRPIHVSHDLDATKAIREVFERWLNEKYDKKKKPSLHVIFGIMSGAEWSRGFELNKDGKRVPKLLPEDQRPTEDQFRYYFNHHHDAERSAEQRMGTLMAARASKVRDMDTRHLAFGPNSLWMGDGMDSGVSVRDGDEESPESTEAKQDCDIFIIDEDNPLLILGGAKIYALGDVFTGAVVIAYATLEEESYESIKTAFELATCDKVEYCKQHGITIEEHEWPFRHVPDAILTDRGPLRGKMGDHLAKAFGIEIQTTAPYRPDLKGFIERTNRTIRQGLLNSLPGASRGRRQPGEEDSRLQTALTLKELNALLITATLYHNNFRRRRNYPLTPDMRRDGVQPYPIDLWRWGAKRRSGVMKRLPQDLVRQRLLPRASASMTEQGLYFGKLYYGCKATFFHAMRFRAKHRGTQVVEIAYDPRLVDIVYLIRDSGREFVLCEVKGGSDRFKGRTWAEVKALLKEERRAVTYARTRDDQGALACQTLAENIVKKAVDRASQLIRPRAKSAQVAGIRERRKAAKIRHRVEAARRAHGQTPSSSKPQRLHAKASQASVPPTRRRTRFVKTFNKLWKGGHRG